MCQIMVDIQCATAEITHSEGSVFITCTSTLLSLSHVSPLIRHMSVSSTTLVGTKVGEN